MAEIDKLVNDLVRKRLEEERDARHWADKDVAAKHALDLRQRYASFIAQDHPAFAPGDVVEWKTGMKNRRRPSYGEPAIVVDVLAGPFYEEDQESGSPYFHEPLDLLLGIVDSDGDFICYYFDRRRFRRAGAQGSQEGK